MNISVLIPSRGNMPRLLETISSLFVNAAYPDGVEVIVRLDADEHATVPALHGTTFIVGPRLGYVNINRYYQECFALAKGKLIWIMDDDTRPEGKHWDATYIMALEESPFGVAGARLSGDTYPWAVPMMRRDLAELYDWSDTNTERVMDIYAQISGRGVIADVGIHHRNEGKTDEIRASHQRMASENWNAKMQEWGGIAQRLLERTT